MTLLPESCGLRPPRRRRRTPGLRRDEVSALAGISTGYYTWNPRDHALRQFVRTFANGPAVLLTPWLDVIDSNSSACDVLGIALGTNLAEAILCGGNVARIANADSLAPGFVALLRHNHAIDVENARFGHVITALRNGSPAFRASWDTHVIEPMGLFTFKLVRHSGDVAALRGLVVSDPIDKSHLALLMQPQVARK